MVARKLLLVALLAAAFTTGCGGSDGDAGTSPTAGATGTGAATDNTKQVCDEAKALGEEYKTKAAGIITRAVQEADDEAKAEQILAEIVPLSKEYKAKFEALGAKANNQQLKDALTTLAKDLDNASGETAAEATGAAEETLTGICGA